MKKWMDQNWIFILFSIKVTFALPHTCGKQYINRGPLCCKSIFNCPPGHEILPCTNMYDEETCQPCVHGKVQPDYISSLDESRHCFQKQEECTAYDLTHSKRREFCYPRYCKCRVHDCFYDDHCVCVRARPCPVNQTLDINTGECRKCPKFSYKNTVGCGPCLVDTEAWRNEKENQDQGQVTLMQDESRTGQPEEHTTTKTQESTDQNPERKNCGNKVRNIKRRLRRKIKMLERKNKRIERKLERIQKRDLENNLRRISLTKSGKTNKIRSITYRNGTAIIINGKH